MGRDKRQLQQNRARKRARMDARKKQRRAEAHSQIGGFFACYGCTRGQATKGEIHGAWVDDRIFMTGLGQAVLARRLSAGRLAVGVFLLDVHCLGVKDAFFVVMNEEDIRHRLLDRMASGRNLAPVSAAHLRKLVDSALAYAADLGFEPAEDFEDARLVLEGIDPAECKETFTFGKDGKPFFCNGPQISEAQAEEIVRHLEKRCGPDGFCYQIIPPDEGDPDSELLVEIRGDNS